MKKVTFNDSVDVRTYIICNDYRTEKKLNCRRIRYLNKSKNLFHIVNTLYIKQVSELEYVCGCFDGKNKIWGIDGYKNSNIFISKIVYELGFDRISYNIYMNKGGFIIAEVNTTFPGKKKKHKEYFISYKIESSIYKAEYKAKLFVLKTIRKILNNNNIM